MKAVKYSINLLVPGLETPIATGAINIQHENHPEIMFGLCSTTKSIIHDSRCSSWDGK